MELWSLSKVRRPATDSSKSVWEGRPTRLRIHFPHCPQSHFLMSVMSGWLNFLALYFALVSKMVFVRMVSRLMA